MTAPTLEAERAAPELAPCPFCGGKAELSKTPNMWMVECNNAECGSNPDALAVFKHDAIAAWNLRTAAPAPADVALPPLDAEGLPPLPQRTKFYPDRFGYALAYTSEQVRQVQREAYELGRQAAGREGAKQSEARMNAGFQPVVDNIDRAQLDALGKHGGNR